MSKHRKQENFFKILVYILKEILTDKISTDCHGKGLLENKKCSQKSENY